MNQILSTKKNPKPFITCISIENINVWLTKNAYNYKGKNAYIIIKVKRRWLNQIAILL
jgi:hypothetical protein